MKSSEKSQVHFDFDLITFAGPRARLGDGARRLTQVCSDGGLRVGLLDDVHLKVRGVIPLPRGAEVVAEDRQLRVHRWTTRAVVRWVLPEEWGPLFEGTRSDAVVPLRTAWELVQIQRWTWNPGVIILGQTDEGFRFGREILAQGCQSVTCLDSGDVYDEVERRAFEIAGGKMLNGKVLSIRKRASFQYELRVEDSLGTRILEVSRVIAVPRRGLRAALREYPNGSFLFEAEVFGPEYFKNGNRSARAIQEELDIADLLAWKISRGLLNRSQGSPRRPREKVRSPWTWEYENKWLNLSSRQKLMESTGVPKDPTLGMKASVECFEAMSCRICQEVCPEKAITRDPQGSLRLIEERCTGCGKCIAACPSLSIVGLKESPLHSHSTMVMAHQDRLENSLQEKDAVELLNRRGEAMGMGRVGVLIDGTVHLQVPTSFLWEARGFRKANRQPMELVDQSIRGTEVERVPVLFEKEKRFLPARIPLSLALFEAGKARAEDVLNCRDGACGLCRVEIDGIPSLACETEVRQGMSARLTSKKLDFSKGGPDKGEVFLCPCLGISVETVHRLLNLQKIHSVEAALRLTGVASGRCHGMHCLEPFLRRIAKVGVDVSQWIDWRFPSSEWVLRPSASIAARVPNKKSDLKSVQSSS